RPHSRPATAPGSDTEATADGDVIVPECEVTLGTPEKIGWNEFSSEVLKLTHTLRCKGWRRIALDRYKELEIKRISGALTNVVYMVSPPPIIEEDASDSRSTRKPSKLLLRIYGAQVSHLIDRETELSILRRLARKKIGPRLLGTFVNGRFEEFFNAETLTKDDIRNPETSRQIAKRMRELHEGVDLEDHEIRAGPVVWLNWGKWVNRAREIMKAVEAQGGQKGGMLAWEMFENAVKRYREWLVARYGGEEGLRKELVFAHNDTQYGNILRLKPIGDSPLLLPMNTHKQLIVIDFEYASANCPGFEFANHFCEWMANYHSPDAPHVVHESFFPTLQEQRNFLRAYVGHWLPGTRTPSYQKLPPSSTSSTPTHAAATPPGQFMLDSRTPFGLSNSYKEEEIARQAALEAEAERLREEARAWRPASHAMWAAWGVVQAKIPTSGDKGSKDGEEKAPPMTEGDKEMEVEGEFDYLGYAQQRVLLFWGDMISLGIMSEEEVG
ncbi:kinase-like domain-containing protein, partial [Kalaharituber pfeilii]